MPLSPVGSLSPALVLTRPDLGIRVRPSQAPTFTSWDLSAGGGATSGGNADLSLVEAVTANGGAVASGNAGLALVEAVAGSGGATASGSASLAVLIALAASGGGAAGGSAALLLFLTPAASGSPTAGGSATIALLLALAANGAGATSGSGALSNITPPGVQSLIGVGAARSSGSADLQIWTLGVLAVAVSVPRTVGSYILVTPITGIQREYVVSPDGLGAGTVQVPPYELARFLRAVPGSLVVDPVQAELFRLYRPFVPQVAGPFRGE